MSRNFYIENLGCAKNQVDAEVLVHNLEKRGMTFVQEPEKADFIIVNTCAFIDSAKKESIDTFFELKNKYPNAKIIVSGCLAQRYASSLEKDLPEADCIFGNRDLSKISDAVELAEKRSVKDSPFKVVPEYPDSDSESDERGRLFNYPGSAYLKISEGCNHRCGYCAIPIIRGSLRSRPFKYVVEEAKRLVTTGIRELNIVAQDLAAYGSDWDGKSHFTELLEKLCKIEGNFKIRMLYIHPDAFPEDLLPFMQNNDKIIRYFDIPVQHASQRILTQMKRAGNSDIYFNLVSRIRKALPDAVIRTTILLGFPGETDEDFNEVYNFIKRCRFDWMGSFTYSLEEDTYAYTITTEKEHNELNKKAVKWQKKLEKLQEKITSEMLSCHVGKEYDVIIEELVEGEDLAIGRIYAQAPDVDGLTVVMGRDMIPGNVYRCGITKVNGIDLEAVKI